jgi:hypothetical protein
MSIVPGLALGTCSVYGFPRQRIRMQRSKYCWTITKETVFSVWFVPTCYKQNSLSVEAGSNTSTVALRVVGGDEKGSLESETVKYGDES